MGKAIEVDKLPTEAFMSCLMVQNIAKIRLLTREQKRNRTPGSPDVLMQCVGQRSIYVSRQDIASKCKTVKGNAVIVGGLRTGADYTVVIPCNTPVRAIHIPNTKGNSYYVVNVPSKNGMECKPLKGGQMVVFPVQNGKLVTTMPLIISRAVFDKMIVIKEKSQQEYNDRLRKSLVMMVRKQKALEEGAKANDLSSNMSVVQRVQAKKEAEMAEREQERAPFVIVGRILKKGTLDQVIGYVVSNGKAQKAFPLKQVMQMCNNKQIRNATLVRNASGKVFMRGVGTILDTLPTTYR